MGLMFSDHLQPGSNASREAVKSPRVTTSALPFSNVLVSSGEFRLFFCKPSKAMTPHLLSPTSLRRSGLTLSPTIMISLAQAHFPANYCASAVNFREHLFYVLE